MRFIEFLADKLMETSLFEMAYERKKAINEVSALARQIKTHLVKLYAFDDQAHDHWVMELDTFFSDIDDITLTPNNKKLSGDIYYQLLWDQPLNNGVGFITKLINRMVARQYSNCKRSSLTDVQIYEQIEKVLHTISYDIANNKFVSFRNYVS